MDKKKLNEIIGTGENLRHKLMDFSVELEIMVTKNMPGYEENESIRNAIENLLKGIDDFAWGSTLSILGELGKLERVFYEEEEKKS